MVSLRRRTREGVVRRHAYVGVAVASAMIVAAALLTLLSSREPELDTGSSYLENAVADEVASGDVSGSATSDAAATDTIGRQAKEEGSHSAPLASSSGQRDFYSLAKNTGTDKVKGTTNLPACRDSGGTGKQCRYPGRENMNCKVFGHFYDSIYQRWLGPMSTDDADPFQFLEIGFFNGRGFEAYTEFLPRAELHSMEISCLPSGPRDEGKWPWPNFAVKHRWYQSLLDEQRLHCGDASSFDFLNEVWTTKMKRPGAPPLRVVIDDGAHESPQMVATVFFWFPRIAPGGILVVEDIEPHTAAGKFRTDFLPQILHDVHYCGGEGSGGDRLRFPSLHPFLRGVHCEMHVCVFERNGRAADEPDEGGSAAPPHALYASKFAQKPK